MIIVSKYDLQETIARLQNSICFAEQYKPFMNSDLFQNYWGTVSDDRFRLQKGLGTKHLTISGRVYEKESKTYIMFWPVPNINHIIILIIFVVLTVTCLIKNTWMVILFVMLVLGIISLLEFKILRDEYVEFQEFIRDLL